MLHMVEPGRKLLRNGESLIVRKMNSATLFVYAEKNTSVTSIRIRNEPTGRTIYPIGSSCIKKFDRNDMNEEATVMEGMARLYRAIRNQERKELSS